MVTTPNAVRQIAGVVGGVTLVASTVVLVVVGVRQRGGEATAVGWWLAAAPGGVALLWFAGLGVTETWREPYREPLTIAAAMRTVAFAAFAPLAGVGGLIEDDGVAWPVCVGLIVLGVASWVYLLRQARKPLRPRAADDQRWWHV